MVVASLLNGPLSGPFSRANSLLCQRIIYTPFGCAGIALALEEYGFPNAVAEFHAAILEPGTGPPG
jgi:hypothetical protein